MKLNKEEIDNIVETSILESILFYFNEYCADELQRRILAREMINSLDSLLEQVINEYEEDEE